MVYYILGWLCAGIFGILGVVVLVAGWIVDRDIK